MATVRSMTVNANLYICKRLIYATSPAIYDLNCPGTGIGLTIKRIAGEHHTSQAGTRAQAVPDIFEYALGI